MLSLTEQRHATRDLPRPVVALVPPHMEYDVRGIIGFVPVAWYGPYCQPLLDDEIGCVENVRHVVSDTKELRYISGKEAAAFIAKERGSMLRIVTFSRKRPFRRRQYHARIVEARSNKIIWRTAEGYNNRGERDAAITKLIEGLGVGTPKVELP